MSTSSRRTFIAASAAFSLGRVLGANDKLNIGIVGIGGRGNDHIKSYATLPNARIVALCDVNQAALETGQAAAKKLTGEQPKGYDDMRKLFADKDVDAVSITTPNHWHALSTIWACQAGKDVYCEKPACYNVYEGERMIEVARKTGRMVQIGSQSRSLAHKIKAMQLLHDGVIGKVYMAKGLCFKRRPSIGTRRKIRPCRPASIGTCSSAPRPCARSTRCASSTTGTGSGTRATATSATRACMKWISRAGAWAKSHGPRAWFPPAASTSTTTIRRRPTRSSPPSITATRSCSSKCAASIPAARATSPRAAATTSATCSTAPMAGW